VPQPNCTTLGELALIVWQWREVAFEINGHVTYQDIIYACQNPVSPAIMTYFIEY
jgi:hypothetical protein